MVDYIFILIVLILIVSLGIRIAFDECLMIFERVSGGTMIGMPIYVLIYFLSTQL